MIAGCAPALGDYDVDIIILSFNRLSDTIEAVQSALGQRGVSTHVSVLDQGSSTETVRSLAQKFRHASHFSLYETVKNLGVAGGRNLLATLGHGRFIVALDNDAIFQNNWVAARVCENFSKTPELGALAFNILGRDGVHPDRASWGYPPRLLKRFAGQFDTTTFVGAGHAIRRVTWNAVGGYDPSLFFTWEEYDFCLKAISLGWRIRYDGSLERFHAGCPYPQCRR